MPKSTIVPVTNVYAKGSYTAKVKIGSESSTAHLILDSGSSALVVQGEDYQPELDNDLQPTSLAQAVTYGLGGWSGPVINTSVGMGNGPFAVKLNNTSLAFTQKEKQGCFGDADGIMGLAYYELSKAYDLTEYLQEHDVEPTHTYPWYLAQSEHDDSIKELKSLFKKYPKIQLTPYFSQLEQQGVVGNQFALLVHRSSIYQTSSKKNLKQLKRHPLNMGLFVMGEPRFQKHLYRGGFKEVKVLDNKYYNVNVKSLRVGNNHAHDAPQLAEKHKHYKTNGIIDTGASAIVLPKTLFDQMIIDLVNVNPEFDAILEPYKTFEGVEEGVDLALLDLEKWPSIYLILEGLKSEDVELELKPQNYWQIHAPQPNQASFQFVFLESWPNQCILGLPLIASYFTIFDRQKEDKGIVLFAEKPKRLNPKIGQK